MKEQIASKCECYNPETRFCSETLSGSCMGEKCQTFNLIKQLDIKTQECKKLEKRLSTCIDCRASNMLPPDCDELRVINDRYYKALEEIEEVIDSIFDRCPWRKTDSCMPVYNVCEELIKTLDIINNVKGENNEQ